MSRRRVQVKFNGAESEALGKFAHDVGLPPEDLLKACLWDAMRRAYKEPSEGSSNGLDNATSGDTEGDTATAQLATDVDSGVLASAETPVATDQASAT